MEPGLVGGHCIGVDPYYLTYKAEQLGYHPEIITSGRRINDNMARYVATEGVKKMIQAGRPVHNARILVLGVTFKENCPDTRNSKVVDLIAELKSFSCQVFAFDPHVDKAEIEERFGACYFDMTKEEGFFDAVFLTVPHQRFADLDLSAFFQKNTKGVLIDIRSRIPRNSLPDSVMHWRL
jgi:UDP-N-acetyl-D-galactosamine dehydrogenase